MVGSACQPAAPAAARRSQARRRARPAYDAGVHLAGHGPARQPGVFMDNSARKGGTVHRRTFVRGGTICRDVERTETDTSARLHLKLLDTALTIDA